MTTMMELAQFTVRPGAEEQFVADRPAMLAALRERFPGLLAAYLTREPDGGWLDVLIWRTPEEAAESARLIATIPACAAWLAHIAKSSALRHTEIVDAFPQT